MATHKDEGGKRGNSRSYVPKSKKPSENERGSSKKYEVIGIKNHSIILLVEGNGMSIPKTDEHKSIKIGDKIPI